VELLAAGMTSSRSVGGSFGLGGGCQNPNRACLSTTSANKSRHDGFSMPSVDLVLRKYRSLFFLVRSTRFSFHRSMLWRTALSVSGRRFANSCPFFAVEPDNLSGRTLPLVAAARCETCPSIRPYGGPVVKRRRAYLLEMAPAWYLWAGDAILGSASGKGAGLSTPQASLTPGPVVPLALPDSA